MFLCSRRQIRRITKKACCCSFSAKFSKIIKDSFAFFPSRYFLHLFSIFQDQLYERNLPPKHVQFTTVLIKPLSEKKEKFCNYPFVSLLHNFSSDFNKVTKRGAYSGIIPGGGFNCFLSTGGSAPVGSQNPPVNYNVK